MGLTGLSIYNIKSKPWYAAYLIVDGMAYSIISF
jgi:hypothetical protein